MRQVELLRRLYGPEPEPMLPPAPREALFTEGAYR